MKRRDAIRIMPLSIAGIAGLAANGFGGELEKDVLGGEPLALQYSKKVRGRLNWIRETQSQNLMEAAYAIAGTVENGGTCYQVAWDAGHTESDSWQDRNGEPEIFSRGFNLERANKGDLVIASGQLTSAAEARGKGVYIIGCPSSWSGDARYPELLRDDIQEMKLRPHADLFIENRATSLGGLMNIPGMAAPFGPVSGIVGKTTIWMMLADACRILAKKGRTVPVKGDGPKLGSGSEIDWQNFSGWSKLGDPLMDDYFDEAMKQIEYVFSELGTLKKIGDMCAETTLNGGLIYGYSRYSSVAGEASTRRSGLALTRGVTGSRTDPNDKNAFPGTKDDIVIMGITKPDDEIDIAYLDMFRKRGVKVISLGAATRSHAVPSGRTVPKETDLHAGKMCDTYGLFAIPGFEKRVCPTSGVLLDHLWWTSMMCFVESYIEKSGGNVPGFYFSGALKGGMEHLYRMGALYDND